MTQRRITLLDFQQFLVALTLINFVGNVNATCSQTEFDNCVKNLPVRYPCRVGEFDSYCSNNAASRQCLNNINCAEGDAGYTTVTNFGSFSNYVTKRNEIDSNLMLCNYRAVLSNQSSCVLTYHDSVQFSVNIPIDFNAINWIGDHCGFLSAYYGNRYISIKSGFGKDIAQIVVNATLKRYELQQRKCPVYDWSLPYDEAKLKACFNVFNGSQTDFRDCSTFGLDALCSTIRAFQQCFPKLELAVWGIGYVWTPCHKYYPVVRLDNTVYIDSYQYLCSYKSVINSKCTLAQATANSTVFDFLQNEKINNSTCEEFCRALNASFDNLYATIRRNNFGEEFARILVKFYRIQFRYHDCYTDVNSPTSAANSHSPCIVIVLPVIGLLLASISKLFFTFG